MIRNLQDVNYSSGAVAAGTLNAFQSGPNIEGIDAIVADSRSSPAPALGVGTLWVENFTAANTGDASYSPSSIPAQQLPLLSYGVLTAVSIPSAPAYGTALAPATTAGGAAQIRIRQLGSCLALCTTPTGIAIAAGTPLCADGNGNLTPFPAPSAAPTPVITNGGTAGSTAYSYALVPVSAAGVPGAIGTAGATATGNATLTTVNNNVITWTPVADAASYIVVRTVAAGTPNTTGVIGYVNGDADNFTDVGYAIIPNTSATQFYPRLSAPGTPTVAQIAGATAGTTSYSYKVTAVGPNGVWSAESSAGTLSTGAATLSTTNANKVTWTAVTGAQYYAIDRTVGGTTQGFVGYSNAPTAGFIDYGLPATAFTAVTSPAVTAATGQVLAVAKGTLAAATSTPTAVLVNVGGF